MNFKLNDKLKLVIIPIALSFIIGFVLGTFDILQKLSLFFGALLGSFVAWIIALKQIKSNNQETKQSEEMITESECLITTIEKLSTEIYDNKTKVAKLIEALQNIDQNQDLTTVSKKLKTTASSLSKSIYANLPKSAIDEKLPANLKENIFTSYQCLDNSKTLINEFIITLEKEQPENITDYITDIQDNLHQTSKRLDKTYKFITEYLENKKLIG